MIGSILKCLRAEKSVTQMQLAERLNVKQSTISSWEIERTSPTLAQLGDLANVFDVTTDYLIGRTSDYMSNGELSPEYKRRIKAQDTCYSLRDAVNIISDYRAEGNMEKTKLVEFLAHMNETDLLELCNAIAALIETKQEK